MFTGIVQSLGTVLSANDCELLIHAPDLQSSADPFSIGESIAVNGCCLTLLPDGQGVRFELSPETVHRTALGTLGKGSEVNLERAMRPSDRFGGHIVQGHIDTVGKICEIEDEGEHHRFRFEIEPAYDRYLIDKGSICIDGISLTVVKPEIGFFDVWVIPHTFENTNLRNRRQGDSVNIEFDVLAKHVEKLVTELRARR